MSISNCLEPECHTLNSPNATALGSLLLQTFGSADGELIVLQIPTQKGYVAHADPWSFRVADCSVVSNTQSFLEPLDKIPPFEGDIDGVESFIRAFTASAGAVVSPLPFNETSIQQLEVELKRRLSLPWLSPHPVQASRVCLVLEGEISIPATEARWKAAVAMGIQMVILSSGFWWEDDKGPFAHLREGFIKADLSPGPTLGKRIADAINSYEHPIDGVFALSDTLLVPVAEAATSLGLWTNGPKPYSISTNKFLTRQLLDAESEEFFSITSAEELESHLQANQNIRFPVVCKPFCGRGSEGVFRADDAEQLKHAVSQAIAAKTDPRILIEPYVDGPEVDCNIVLLNGRVLYSEIVDDFPCDADVAENATDKLFAETEAVYPSRLPYKEQELIERDVLEAIRLQGFNTGVFHCEARVRDSSMNYVLQDGATIPDLEITHKESAKPSTFLHEINARIPGIASSASTMIGSGIDFWALQLLCAVQDWERYQNFSIPFSSTKHDDHVWLTNAIVPITYEGVKGLFPRYSKEELDHQLVDSGHSPVLKLAERHGELTKYVKRHNANIKDGVKYGFPQGVWIWAACIVISSPISRSHALSIAEDFKRVYSEYVGEMYYQT